MSFTRLMVTATLLAGLLFLAAVATDGSPLLRILLIVVAIATSIVLGATMVKRDDNE